MADQLNMNGLSLGPDGQPARSYIPPHLRNRPSGPPMNGGPPAGGPPAGGPPPAGPPAGIPPTGPPGPPPGGNPAPAGDAAAAGGPQNGLGGSNWAK
jgi:hypothetical protein